MITNSYQRRIYTFVEVLAHRFSGYSNHYVSIIEFAFMKTVARMTVVRYIFNVYALRTLRQPASTPLRL